MYKCDLCKLLLKEKAEEKQTREVLKDNVCIACKETLGLINSNGTP